MSQVKSLGGKNRLCSSKYDSPNLHKGCSGLSGLKSHDAHGENPERMPVQGLEQPTHPENLTPNHRHYHHAPP
jgi:hypothetical protein